MTQREKNNRGPVRVTLQHVAAHAGVSRATASLVLRGSSLVSESTSQRVANSMRELGYIYDRGAASLRTQRSRTIGLIITDISTPFFAELTLGIETRLDQDSYVVLLSTASDTQSRQERILATMLEHRVDGLLLCPSVNTPPSVVDLLRQQRLPCVLVVRYLPGVEVDCVRTDNVLGAELAIEHLIAHGHSHIAIIGGPSDSSSRRDRLQGYFNVLERHNIAVDESLLIVTPVTREAGYRAIGDLLAIPNPPTAALCYNDIVAFGVMLGLRSLGLEAGRDFGVVGFDDIAESALWRPALTTLAVHPRRIGEEAANLLLQRISHPDEPTRQVILAPTLVVRQSCRTTSE